MKIKDVEWFDYEEFEEDVLGYLEQLRNDYYEFGDTKALAISQNEKDFVESCYETLASEAPNLRDPEFEDEFTQDDVKEAIREIFREASK